MLNLTMPEKNCLGCSKYLECKDKLKSVIYVCKRFSETKYSVDDSKRRIMDFAEVSSMDTTESGIYVPKSTHSGASFDIMEMLSKEMSEDSMVSSDIRINDRDFTQAPNFYQWCVGEKYLKQKPYLEQAIIGLQVFAEFCPRCSDMEWMDNTHKVTDSLAKLERRVCMLELGVCPSCKVKRTKLFKTGELNYYNEAAIVAGQRSGKSAWLGMAASYITHMLIKMQKPNEIYGLMNANVLHGTFVALTYAQAKDTLWEPYYGNLVDSPWFKNYHEFLTHRGEQLGDELFKLKDTFVLYKHRRILFYPAGPDKRTLRGRTRSLAAIDELGWFDNSQNSSKVKMNANEVYIALQRSLLTVRSSAEDLVNRGFHNIPTGYFLNISSPSSVRDKIMELVAKSQGSTKIFGIIRPTWLMNPRVPRSVLAEEFRLDPVAAARDYGCEPPLTSNPFISSQSAVEQCFSGKKNPLTLIHRQKKRKDGTATRYASVVKIGFGPKPSVLAIDAGYTNNSFACCVANLDKNGYPRISLLAEVMPLPGIPLNYTLVFKELLTQIILERNIVLLAADRWNSLKVLSDAEAEFGITTRQYSLKYSDMQLFKTHLLDNQMSYPSPAETTEQILVYSQSEYPKCFQNRTTEHFVLQLLTVQDTGSGVIKGDNLTDDLVRAAMLAVAMLLDPTNEECFAVPDAEEVSKKSVGVFGVMRGGSGGGVSKGQGGVVKQSLGVLRKGSR